MNNNNLKSLADRTTEEQREIASAGGKASAEARRKRKAAKEAAEMILSLSLNGDPLQDIEDIKSLDELKTANTDALTAIIAKLTAKALDGNTKAIELLLTLTGDYSASLKVSGIIEDDSYYELQKYFARGAQDPAKEEPDASAEALEDYFKRG